VARKPLPAAMIEPTAGSDAGRRNRFLLAALAAAALAVVMSGCVILKSQTSTQLNVIGNVQLTTVICASDKDSNDAGYGSGDSTCQGNTADRLGNSNQDSSNNFNIQVLVAYRISNAVTQPTSFQNVATTPPSGGASCPAGSLTFNESSSYESALEAGSSSGSSQKWVGYISTGQTFVNTGCHYVTVQPSFQLNQGFGVAPYVSPVDYRAVVGYRTYDNTVAGSEATRTVTCGSSLFTVFNDGADGNDADTTPDQQGICIDHPYGGASAISTNLSQTTRDLGVIPATNASVNVGQTANVSFTLDYEGATLPSGQFNITANTTIPGATATPSPTSWTPPSAGANTTVNVSIPVPAGTTPGTYDVFVIATLSSNGQTRGGIVPATVTVGALIFNPAPTLPALGTVTLNGQSQTKTAQMNNFGVNDTTTSPSGWNVTVAGDATGSNSAVFKQYCNSGSACNGGSHPPNSYVSGGFTLPANSLTLNSTSASFTGGTGSAPTFQCGGGSCAIDSATPTKIASAANGSAGTGLWSTTGFTSSSVRLSTATTLRALPASEIYRVNEVWSLNSGP
jgi:hypothetical protein